MAPDTSLCRDKGKDKLSEFDSSSGPSEPESSLELILISSVLLHPPSQNHSLEDRHLMVVDKVIDALANSPHSDQNIDDSSSNDVGSLQEVDDDMIFGHY